MTAVNFKLGDYQNIAIFMCSVTPTVKQQNNDIMEKFTIEIETSAGWVMLHSIMRPGEERALAILKELREKYPQSKLRVVKWIGTPVKD